MRVLSDRTGHGNDSLDDHERFTFFSSSLTAGVNDLRQILQASPDERRPLVAEGLEDARRSLVLACLDEVFKTGVSILLWRERLEGDQIDATDRTARLILEATVDEQHQRERVLAEALVTMIGFTGTNDEAHFRCYLALTEFNRMLGVANDTRIFDGRTPDFITAHVERLRATILRIEATEPTTVNAWYRSRNSGIASLTQPGRALTSVASRYRNAIPSATPAEVLALGETYGRRYAEISVSAHFTPLADSEVANVDAVKSLIGRCGLLGQHVLCRAVDLVGLIPLSGPCARLYRLHAGNDVPARLLEDRHLGIDLGDAVLADRFPATVEEIQTSSYGRRIYRVRFTGAARPPGSGDEDWFPSHWVERV